jgi:hypothetical protein
VRLGSLSASRRQRARLPIPTLPQVLVTLHGLRLSRGALGDVLHRLQRAPQAEQAALLAPARARPLVPRDATGWRENGPQGFVGGLTTPGPQPLCYSASDRSRAGVLAAPLLATFAGYRVTAYSWASNHLRCKHPRCGVPLRRALHALKEAPPAAAAGVQGAQDVRTLDDDAPAAVDGPQVLTARPRTPLARQWEAQAYRLAVV